MKNVIFITYFTDNYVHSVDILYYVSHVYEAAFQALCIICCNFHPPLTFYQNVVIIDFFKNDYKAHNLYPSVKFMLSLDSAASSKFCVSHTVRYKTINWKKVIIKYTVLSIL